MVHTYAHTHTHYSKFREAKQAEVARKMEELAEEERIRTAELERKLEASIIAAVTPKAA